MRNIGLVLAYDGTEYAGFQVQPNGITVQAVLEAAIAAVTGEPGAKLAAVAGRTDAGVHARGQVVNFRTAARIPADRIPLALNTRLPPSVRCLAAWEAPPEFHARFAARRKTYSYTIDNAPVPDPLRRLRAYHCPHPLDVAAMAAAAQLLVGRHDFAAFRASGGAAKTSVRSVSACTVTATPRAWALPGGVPLAPATHRDVVLRISADGFLYNMVRIIAGTLLEVGLGKRTAADVQRALDEPRRSNAGKTLPPVGLCLEHVEY